MSDHDPPTIRHVPGLVLRFAPRYLRHVVRRPYRRGTAPGPLGTRHRTAMYDAVLELMLRGYAELSGQRLRPEAGPAAVLFLKLGFAFDDEYERREAAGASLAFHDVFGSEAMRHCLDEWRAFMAGIETYGTVRDFLYDFSARLYAAYVAAPTDSPSLPTLLRQARLDSGELLAALAHVLARMHGTEPTARTVAQFASLGVIAKLADDHSDATVDLAAGRPNLVLLVAGEDPAENELVCRRLATGQRMGHRRWRREAPRTYLRLVGLYRESASAITSVSLRLAGQLMWLPVLTGHVTRVEVRGRV